ncbi:MAG: hypothetical protein MHM6MM_008394 [Cercozoa sp. M6MM]
MTRASLRQALASFAADFYPKVADQARSRSDDSTKAEQLEAEVTQFAREHSEGLATHGDLLLECIRAENHLEWKAVLVLLMTVSAVVPRFPTVMKHVIAKFYNKRLVFSADDTGFVSAVSELFRFVEEFCAKRYLSEETGSFASTWRHESSANARAFFVLSLAAQPCKAEDRSYMKDLSRASIFVRFPQSWQHVALWARARSDASSAVLSLLSFVEHSEDFVRRRRLLARALPLPEYLLSKDLPHSAGLVCNVFGLEMCDDGVTRFVCSPRSLCLERLSPFCRRCSLLPLVLVQALVLHLWEHPGDALSVEETEHILRLLAGIIDSFASQWVELAYDDAASLPVHCDPHRPGRPKLRCNLSLLWPLVTELSWRIGSFRLLSHLYQQVVFDVLGRLESDGSLSLATRDMEQLNLASNCDTPTVETSLRWLRRCSDELAFSGVEEPFRVPEFWKEKLEAWRLQGLETSVVASLLSFFGRSGVSMKVLRTLEHIPTERELEEHRRRLFAPVSKLLESFLCDDVHSAVRDFLLDPSPRAIFAGDRYCAYDGVF